MPPPSAWNLATKKTYLAWLARIEGRVPDISATVSGISWVPGTDLWLRWGDVQLSGGLADDGLGIDTVRFVAVPEPASLWLAGLGAIAALSRRRRQGSASITRAPLSGMVGGPPAVVRVSRTTFER